MASNPKATGELIDPTPKPNVKERVTFSDVV